MLTSHQPIDRRADRPFYLQIADRLRDAITSGELTPGERLPSTHELAEIYSVTPPVVTRAVRTLCAEGLAMTEKGRGTFVREHRPRIRSARRRLAKARASNKPVSLIDVTEAGAKWSMTITSVDREPIPPEAANRLNIEEGTPLLARRRVVYTDDEPVELSVSYFPDSVVAMSCS